MYVDVGFLDVLYDYEEMEKLLCAPSELLVKIFEFLPASDLVSLAKTCRRFRDVVAIDQIWHDLSQKGELTCINLFHQSLL